MIPNDTDALYAGIQDYVIKKIAKVLNIDGAALDLRRNIMDMGMSSLQLIEVGAVIQKELDIELYPTLFFEYTNVKELTDYFHSEHRQIFTKLIGQKTQADHTSAAVVVVAAYFHGNRRRTVMNSIGSPEKGPAK